jgi:hypothetical protein
MDTPVDTTSGGTPLGGSVADIDGTIYLSGIVGLQADAISDNDGALFRFLISSHEDDAPKAPGEWLDIDLDPGSAKTCGPFAQGVDAVGDGDGAPGFAGVDDDMDGGTDLSDLEIMLADFDCDGTAIGAGGLDFEDEAYAAFDDDEDGLIDMDFPFNEDPWYVDDFMRDHDQEFFVLGFNSTVADSHPHDITESNQFIFDTDYFEETLFGYCSPHCAEDIRNLIDAGMPVFLKSAVYDWAGNVRIDYAAPIPVIIDNYIAGAMLSLWQLDGITEGDEDGVRVGIQAYGEKTYLVKAEPSEPEDVAGITFQLYQDFGAGYVYIGDIGPEDTSPPYAIEWKVPAVGNTPPYNEDEYRITAVVRDKANNMSAADFMYVTAIDITPPVCTLYEVNGVYVGGEVGDHWTFHHIPQASAVPVKAYFEPTDPNNDDIIKVVFEYKYTSEPGKAWTEFASVTGHCECDDGIDNDGDGLIDFPDDPDEVDIYDLTEPEHSGVVVVTWDTRNVPVGDYDVRAVGVDVEGNKDELGAPIRSVTIDVASLRSYVQSPERHSGIIPLWAYSYEMYVKVGPIDRVTFEFYEDTNGNMLPDDGNNWTLIGTTQDTSGTGYDQNNVNSAISRRWNINWDTAGIGTSGIVDYLVRAVAKDAFNNMDEAAPYIPVNVQNIAPIANFVYPAPDGSTVIYPGFNGIGNIFDPSIDPYTNSWEDIINELVEFEVTTNAVDIESMKYYYRIPPDTMWHLLMVDTTQEVAKSPATWIADMYWDTGILMGDRDLDGWVDGYEVWVGTLPNDPMSFPDDDDGDGRSDFEEGVFGTDSLDADDYPADTVLYGRTPGPPPINPYIRVKRNSIEYSSVVWMNNGYYRDDTNVLLKAVAVDTGGVADPFPAETHVIILERMRPYASLLTGPAEGSTVCADSITNITGVAADNRLIDRVELRYCIKDTGGVWDSTSTDMRKHWKVAWVDTSYPYGTWSYWNGVYWEERPYVFDVFDIPLNDPLSGWDVFDLRFGLFAYDVAGNRSFQVDSLDHHIRHIRVDHRPQPYRFSQDLRESENNRFTELDTVEVEVQRLSLGCRRNPTAIRLQFRVNDDYNDTTPNWTGFGSGSGWAQVYPTVINNPGATETFYLPIMNYELAEIQMRLQYQVHDNWVTVNTINPDSVSILVDHNEPHPQTLAYTDIDDWFLLADTIRLWDGNASEWDTLMPGTYLVSGAGHDVFGMVPADSIWFLGRGAGNLPARFAFVNGHNADTARMYYDDDLWYDPPGAAAIRGKITSHLLYRQGDMWPPTGAWMVSDGSRNTESPTFDWVTDDPGFINGYYQLRIRSFDDNYDDGICTPESSAPPCSANVARSGVTSFTMYVDVTDPEAYIDPSLDGMLFADQITVEAFLTDDSQYADVDSVLFYYRVYKASGTPNPWQYFASQHIGDLEVVFDADSLGLGFGSYDLVAMAIDLAGNWENSGIGGAMDIDPELAGNENTGYVTVTRTEGPRFSQIYGLYFTPYDNMGPSDLGNSLNRSDELDTTGFVKMSGDELDFLVETMGYPAEVESVYVTISRGSTKGKETFSYDFPLVKLTGNGVPITFTLYESDFPDVYDWTSVGLAGDFNGVDPSGTYWNVTEFEMYPDTLNHTWSRTIWLPTLPAWQEQTFGYQFVINHERDRDRWVNDPRNTNNFITYGPPKSEINGGMPVTAVTVPAIPTDPNSDLWWTNIDLTQFTSGVLEWTITAVDEDGWSMTWPTERECDGWAWVWAPPGHKWGCVLDRLPPQAEVTVVDQDLTVKAGGTVDLSAIAPDLPVFGEVYTVTELRFQVLPQNGNDWRDVGTDTNGTDGWRVTWSIPKLDEDNVDNDGDGFVDEDDEADLDATFLVRALPRDDGYNYGDSDTVAVTVDDSDPIAIITNPPTSTVISYGDVVDIMAEIHPDSPDEDAEIDSMQFYYINNSNWTWIGTDRRPYDGWQMMWRTDLLPEEDGYYLVYAMPFDEVGNAGITKVPHLVVINDTLAPAAFITHIVREGGQSIPVVRDEIAISGVVNVKGVAPDPTTVAVKVMFRALGDTDWTLMDSGVVPVATFTGAGVPWDTRLLNLVDTTGVYELAAWAVDEDGNEDENPVIVSVLVDYEIPWHDLFDLYANMEPDPAVFYNGYYPDSSGLVLVGDPGTGLVTFYVTSPHEDIARMWGEFRPQGGVSWMSFGGLLDFEYRDNLECADVIDDCMLERDGVWVLEQEISTIRSFLCDYEKMDINWDVWEFRAVQMDSAGNTSFARHPFGRAFMAVDCGGPDIMAFYSGWDPFDPKDVYEVGDTARFAMAATDEITDVVKAVFYWDPTFAGGDTLWVPVDPDPSTPEIEEAPITVEGLDTEMPVWRSEVLFNTALVGYISQDKSVPLKVKVWDTAGNSSVDYHSITVQDNTPPANTYIAYMKQTAASPADSTLENIAVGGSDVWIAADNPTDRMGLRWIVAEAAPYGTPKDGDWTLIGIDETVAAAFPAAMIQWDTRRMDAEMNPVFPDGDWWVRVYSQDIAFNVEVPDPDNYVLVTVDNTGPVVEIVMPDDGDIFQRYEPGVDPILIEADVVDGSPRDEEMTEVKWYHKQNLEVNIPGNWVTTGFDPVTDDTDPFFTEWTTGANTKANWSYDIIAVGQDELGNGDLSTAAAMAAWEDGLGVTITLVDTIAPWVEVWQVAWMPVIDGHVTVGVSDTIRVTARSQIGDLHVESVLFQYHNGEEWVDIALDMMARGDGAGHAVIWDAMWDVVGLGGTYPVRAVGRDDNDNADTLYSPVVDVTIDAMPPVGEITAYYEFGGDGSETVEITDGTLERGFSNVMFHAHDFVPDEELQNVGFWYKHDQDIATADSSWMYMGSDMNAPHSIVIPKNNTYTMFQYGHTYDFVAIPKDMYDNTPEFGDVYAMGSPYVLTLTVTDETCPQAWITMIDSMTVPDEHIFASGMIDMIMAKTYAPDVERVLLKYREVSTPKGKSMKAAANGDWILIGEMMPYECEEKAPKVDPGQTWTYSGWNTEMLNGFYELAAFGIDNVGNECTDPATVPLTIDNENPATCDLRFLDPETLTEVTNLERGQRLILAADAADDGLYEQSIVVMVDFQYKLHAEDDPTAWQSIDDTSDMYDWQLESPNPDYNEPYAVTLEIPYDVVAHQNYDFRAIATDFVGNTNVEDVAGAACGGQRTYLVEDTEAEACITDLGDSGDWTPYVPVPHINGNVDLRAEADPDVIMVEFAYSTDQVYWTTIDVDSIASRDPDMNTVFMIYDWNVDVLPEGTYYITAVPTDDMGNVGENDPTCLREVVVDHGFTGDVTSYEPMDDDEIGGWYPDCVDSLIHPTDLWVAFDSNADIDSVIFEWKLTAQPDVEQSWSRAWFGCDADTPGPFFDPTGVAQYEGGTNTWTFPLMDCNIPDGMYDFRAKVKDISVPDENVEVFNLATGVIVDNTPTNQMYSYISEVNGDVTPQGTHIPNSATNVSITATAFDRPAGEVMTGIAEVRFLVDGLVIDIDTVADANGVYRVYWNVTGLEPGSHYLSLEVIDEVGNAWCGSDLDVWIDDVLPPTAHIVAYDTDNECWDTDRFWAMVECRDTEEMDQVRFEYREATGKMKADKDPDWINLGADDEGEHIPGGCYVYEITMDTGQLENGMYELRAIAEDAHQNTDPNPPVFKFQKSADGSITPVDGGLVSDVEVWDDLMGSEWTDVTDIARVQSTGGRPYVFALAEGIRDDGVDDCFTDELYCMEVSDVMGADNYWTGINEDIMFRPCGPIFDGYGTVTFFGTVIDGDNYVDMGDGMLTVFEMFAERGTNGMVTSDDGMVEVHVSGTASQSDGQLYIEPRFTMPELPDYQYFYTPVGYAYDIQLQTAQLVDPDADPVHAFARVTLHYNESDVEGLDEDLLAAVWWNPYAGVNGAWVKGLNSGLYDTEVDTDANTVSFKITNDALQMVLWTTDDSLGTKQDEEDCQWSSCLVAIMANTEGFMISEPRFWPQSDAIMDVPVTCPTTLVSIFIRDGDGTIPHFDKKSKDCEEKDNGGCISTCDCIGWSDRINVWVDDIRVIRNGVGTNGYFVCLRDSISGEWIIGVDYDVNPGYQGLEEGYHTIRIMARNGDNDWVDTGDFQFYVDVTPPEIETFGGWFGYHDNIIRAKIWDNESEIYLRDIEITLGAGSTESWCTDGQEFEIGYDDIVIERVSERGDTIWIMYEPIIDVMDAIFAEALGDSCEEGNEIWVEWCYVRNVLDDAVNGRGIGNKDSASEHSECCDFTTECVTTIYIIDSFMPYVTAVVPHGEPIDNDGDGRFNEDPPDDYCYGDAYFFDWWWFDWEDWWIDWTDMCDDCCEQDGIVEDDYYCECDCDIEFDWEHWNWFFMYFHPYDNDGDMRYGEDPIDFTPAVLPGDWMPSIIAYFEDPDRDPCGHSGGSVSGIDPDGVELFLIHGDGTMRNLTEEADITETRIAWSDDEPLDAGRYHVVVFVADNVGNTNYIEWDFIVVRDETAPMITAVAPAGMAIDNDGDGLYNEDPVDFALDCEDACCDDCTWVPYDNDMDGLANEDPIDFGPAHLPVNWMPSIVAYYEDPLPGCVDECEQGYPNWACGIDVESVQLLLQHSDGTLDTLDAEVTETHVSWSAQTELEGGTYHAMVFVSDCAGNSAFHEWSFEVEGDEAPPLVGDIVLGEDIYVGTAQPTICVSFSDEGSGVGSAMIEITDPNGEKFTGHATAEDIATGEYCFTPEEPFTLPGMYTIKAVVTDNNGQMTTVMSEFLLEAAELEITDAHNYPNPFTGATTIAFEITRWHNVRITATVYDFADRKVNTLRAVPIAGQSRVEIPWNGTSSDGTHVGSGVYFIVVNVTDGSDTVSEVIKAAVIGE